jgi:hypothetical protein
MSIPALLFALALVLSASMAWLLSGSARPLARSYLRFACILYGALALAGLAVGSRESTGEFARAVALVVCILAPSVLSLALLAAFRKPLASGAASLLLAFACVAALAAAVTDLAALGLAPLVLALAVAAIAILRTPGRDRTASVEGLGGLFSFLCAASTLMLQGARDSTALDLFSSAGLLGTALALSRASRPRVEGASQKLPRVLAVDKDR